MKMTKNNRTKNIRTVLKDGPNGFSLVVLVCFSIFSSGCAMGKGEEYALAPELEKIAGMEHEPITRLAFVPVSDYSGEIEIIMDDPAQDAASIETAAGEEDDL